MDPSIKKLRPKSLLRKILLTREKRSGGTVDGDARGVWLINSIYENIFVNK
jgi:hypothetical protein